MFWQLALVAAAIWAVYFRWQRRRIHGVAKEVPSCGLPTVPLLGHAHLFAGSDEDRMKIFQKVGQVSVNLGGISSAWMAHKLYVVVADPVVAETVLKSCLDKDDTTMKFLRKLFGNGSLMAPVSIWRPRRKIAAPIFSIKNLNSFMPVFQQQSSIMVQQLEKEAGGGDFSFWKYITTYTFDAICKTSLGIDLNSQQTPNHPFLEAFEVAVHLASERLCCPWLYWDWVYERLPKYKTFIENRDIMYKFVDELIRRQRKEFEARGLSGVQHKSTNPDMDNMRTFLEIMIESSGGLGGYTELELREEVLVMILAGNDTSAVASAYTALMLSRYPDVQENLYQELQDVFGDTHRPVTVQDLPRLKYLEAVIKETLRIYPAVPLIAREVLNDVKLPSGTTLVKGVGILINFWAMHRNPEYWGDDAEQYRPERFLERSLKHPGQFMPFSYSMRNCIGSSYAMMSMKTVLSNLVRRYRLLPASNLKPHQWSEPLRVKFDVMMKHVDNYMIRLEQRNKAY